MISKKLALQLRYKVLTAKNYYKCLTDKFLLMNVNASFANSECSTTYIEIARYRYS